MLLLQLTRPVFQRNAGLRVCLLHELGSQKFASENSFLINEKREKLGGKGAAASLHLSACCLSFSKQRMMNDLFKWIYFSTWIEAWSEFLRTHPNTPSLCFTDCYRESWNMLLTTISFHNWCKCSSCLIEHVMLLLSCRQCLLFFLWPLKRHAERHLPSVWGCTQFVYLIQFITSTLPSLGQYSILLWFGVFKWLTWGVCALLLSERLTYPRSFNS